MTSQGLAEKTVTLDASAAKDANARYAPLPAGITSFGAAVANDAVFVYGGHKGRAHHYYQSGQVNEMWKLDLKHPAEWKVVGTGPHLQGLAMVAHQDKLYRIGGFTAHNKEDEDHDLRSIADVSRFDPKSGEWTSLAPLPQPRSSHDAVVIGDKLYVAGGWQLGGSEDDKKWSTTALVADLSETPIKWQTLPTPPFQRRALSLGELDGKFYVIGGMQQQGGPTTRVDVFDPKTNKWAVAPAMVTPESDSSSGRGMEGFGSSAFSMGDRLFVSTYSGSLQCISSGAKEWRIAMKLADDRFFHRMVPYEGKLLLLGGASMTGGKRLQVEEVKIANLK